MTTPPASAAPRLAYIPTASCHVSCLNTRIDPASSPDWESFVENIAANGVLQSVLVRPTPDGPTPYQIIAGKRRWTAATQAGIAQIPALISSDIDADETATRLMLIENLHRRAFDPIEEALGYRWLMSHGMTQEQVAAAVQIPRQRLADRDLLLDLSTDDQLAVRQKRLALGPAQKRATSTRWISRSLRHIAEHPDGQITAAHHYEASRSFFDPLTLCLRHDLPYLALDDAPTDGELARGVAPERRRLTWRDLIAGSEAGETIKTVRVIDPAWNPIELADAASVKAFIRANTPGHLRKEDTNIAHAEKEAAQYAHIIWDLAASHALKEIEAAGISRFDQATLRTAIVACCARADLDFIGRRLRIDDIHRLPQHTLRQTILAETQHIDPGTLMLEALLLIASRRDQLRLPDHPAVHPLLDELGIDPTTLTDSAVHAVTAALKAKS